MTELLALGKELESILQDMVQFDQIDLSNQMYTDQGVSKEEFIQAFVNVVPKEHRKREFENDVRLFIDRNYNQWLTTFHTPNPFSTNIERQLQQSKVIQMELDLYSAIKTFIEKHYYRNADMNVLNPILQNLKSRTMQIQDHIHQLKSKTI